MYQIRLLNDCDKEKEEKMNQYLWKYQSPMGGMTMAGNQEALTGLWFDGQKYFGQNLSGKETMMFLPVFEQTKNWLDLYFSGGNPSFTPLLKPQGSAFRLDVWELLKGIPYGETRTYGQIADTLAKKRGLPHMSAQAVGGAVGHNPISIIIPCHRLVGSNGSLTGYAGGIDKKAGLLALERSGTG